jgi:hypothetical protein
MENGVAKMDFPISVGGNSGQHPRVAILIPTLGREEKLARLLDLIPKTAEYPNYGVVVLRDSFPPNNIGVPRLVAQGINETWAPLVVYLGNDCVPTPGWLRIAVEAMLDHFPDLDGLIGMNDSIWLKGEMFTHFLVGRALLPMIGGEVFHVGYKRLGCDNELTARAQKLGKAFWCEEARIIHEHGPSGRAPWDEVYALGWNADDHVHDVALLRERSKAIGFDLPLGF